MCVDLHHDAVNRRCLLVVVPIDALQIDAQAAVGSDAIAVDFIPVTVIHMDAGESIVGNEVTDTRALHQSIVATDGIAVSVGGENSMTLVKLDAIIGKPVAV